MINEYRIKISVQNNLLLRAIEDAGYKSQSEFARSIGVSPQLLNGIVAMREAPIGRKGEFSHAAKMIMEALGAAPSDLWTDEQLYIKLTRNSASAEVGAEEAKRLMGESMQAVALPAPDEFVDILEAKRDVSAALDTLTKREAHVIRMIYGIGTNVDHSLGEVAHRMDLSMGRVRQIEAKALGKLRKPKLTDKLMGHLV